jgi:hypothetical protein
VDQSFGQLVFHLMALSVDRSFGLIGRQSHQMKDQLTEGLIHRGAGPLQMGRSALSINQNLIY